MNALYQVIRKEFLQMFRNRLLIVLILFGPVIILGIIPYSLENQAQIRVSMVDKAHAPSSRLLHHRLAASPWFQEVNMVPSEESAKKLMDRGKTDMVLVVPRPPEPLFITVDATHTLSAQDHLYYLSRTMGPEWIPSPVRMEVHMLFNQAFSGKIYFLVSLLVLLITILSVCFTSISIVHEKEKGILDQINATPINRYTYIIGKTIPFLMVCLLEFIFGLLFCFLVHSLHIKGSIPALLLVTTLFLTAMLSLGLLISIISQNQVQAMYTIIFVLITLIMMSPMFALLSSMPEWAQTLRLINPVYFMLDASRLIILKGFSFSHVLPHMAFLSAMAVGLCLSSIVKLHKTSA